MQSSVVFLLAFAAQQTPEAWPQVEVSAPSGRHVAVISKAVGQERVADALARWRVTVFATPQGGERTELWSSIYPHRPGQHYLLSDDGLLLVQVSTAFSSNRTIVRIWREGREVADLAGADLGVEQRSLPATEGASELFWLADPPPALAWSATPDGPELRLTLACRDGRTRELNALTGSSVHAQPAETVRQIDPAIKEEARAQCELPYVRAVNAPRFARAGVPVVLEVEGDFPTPGWRLLGFSFDAAELVIEPQALPVKGPAAQVLTSYSTKVAVYGLAPGSHTLTVRGRDEDPGHAVTIEVLPARLRLRLSTRGGFMGLNEVTELYEGGVLRATSKRLQGERMGLARWAEMELDGLVAHLPTADTTQLNEFATDMQRFELSLWRDDQWVTIVVDDGTAKDAIGAVIERVRAMSMPLLRPPQ